MSPDTGRPAEEPGKIDVSAVRRDTPGCLEVNHLNNAGAALPPQVVTDAVLAFTAREALLGGYECAEQAAGELESTYDAVAALVNARREQIALVENATRAWDMAFYGIPFRRGDRILTCRSEYASNYLAYLQASRRHGIHVDVIPDNEYGELDVAAAANMMDRRVKLISITHVPTNGGLVNPAREVGELARASGCYYLLDACQSVGQMPIDVAAIGCDFLSSTGRKFIRGPRGTGFLYASDRAIAEIEPPFIDGHAATWTSADSFVVRNDARRYENWEFNHATRLGLGAAARYALQIGMPSIWTRVRALATRLRSSLGAIDGARLCDQGRTRCAIVTFVCAGWPARAVKAYLQRRKINCEVSDASWTRIDMDSRGLTELVRASVHYYNTEGEIDALAEAVAALTKG